MEVIEKRIQNEITSILKTSRGAREAAASADGNIFWTNQEGKLAHHLHISGRLWWVYVATILLAVTCLVANEMVNTGIIK